MADETPAAEPFECWNCDTPMDQDDTPPVPVDVDRHRVRMVCPACAWWCNTQLIIAPETAQEPTRG